MPSAVPQTAQNPNTIRGPVGPSPAQVNAVRPAVDMSVMLPGLMPPGSELPNYDNETQEDGSILLYSRNPDGSRGPVVKIVPPIKARA